MSKWDGVFRCEKLGVDDCVVWWDAIAAWASVSAAVGTWVVGAIAGAVAWMAYHHRKNEVDGVDRAELQRRRARHQRWILDLNAASFVHRFVDNFGANSFYSALADGEFIAIIDFFCVCEDALPSNSLVPDGYVFDESLKTKLFHIEHEVRRVRSCIAVCKKRFDGELVDKNLANSEFARLVDWSKELRKDVLDFLPVAKGMEPKPAVSGRI